MPETELFKSVTNLKFMKPHKYKLKGHHNQ